MAIRGVDARGRLGGSKRRHINNFRKPWQESHGKLRGGGNWERDSRSRIHIEVVLQIGKSEFWDGYRRWSGARMTFCGRQRCQDGDR